MTQVDTDHGHAGAGAHSDHAPGDAPPEDVGHLIRNGNIGLAFSTILTAAAFLLTLYPVVYLPALPVALLVLAVAQMGVHLVFFLHITTGPDNTNNIMALAFGVLVVFLIIAGSVWIMGHLQENMMPMEQIMRMQP